jgi:hypothetical protein
MPEILAFQAVLFVCGTVGFVASLRFLYRYLELRQERRALAPPAGLQERLDRIEMIVESTAIEVERISEANRFMAKLLSERTGLEAPAPSRPERVITPH